MYNSIEIRTFRTRRKNYVAFVSIDECQDYAGDVPVNEKFFFGYTEEDARARAIEYAEDMVGGIDDALQEAHECILDGEIKGRFGYYGSFDFIDDEVEGKYQWYLKGEDQ